MRIRNLAAICCTVFLMIIGLAPAANAVSIYDDIVKTTTSVKLQSSTTSCPSSTATEHNLDWSSLVSSALSVFNAQHNNALADWEADWSNKVGWAVIPATGPNDQKYFMVYYSASYGENVFFRSGVTDYFTIYDPAPATPFRSLVITTKGDSYGNCDTQPWVNGASTGGISLTVDNFNTDYKLFLSTFTTYYPYEYEGETIPSEYAPPAPAYYSGTVDCGVDTITYMQIIQDGDTRDVPLTYESVYRASWTELLTSTPYTIIAGCGIGVAASFESVTPMPPTSNDWICDTTKSPRYCVLS